MTPGGSTFFDRALTVCTVAAYAGTLIAVATPGGAVLALVTHALLMAPGIAVVRAALPTSWLCDRLVVLVTVTAVPAFSCASCAGVKVTVWLWSALRLGLGSALSWIAIRKSENGMNFGAMTP